MGGVTILSYSSYFVGDRENIPDYGRARCSAVNKLDPQLETGKVSSHGQVRNFPNGIDEEIIIKVQIFSAVFDIITLLEKTGEPGGI